MFLVVFFALQDPRMGSGPFELCVVAQLDSCVRALETIMYHDDDDDTDDDDDDDEEDDDMMMMMMMMI